MRGADLNPLSFALQCDNNVIESELVLNLPLSLIQAVDVVLINQVQQTREAVSHFADGHGNLVLTGQSERHRCEELQDGDEWINSLEQGVPDDINELRRLMQICPMRLGADVPCD